MVCTKSPRQYIDRVRGFSNDNMHELRSLKPGVKELSLSNAPVRHRKTRRVHCASTEYTPSRRAVLAGIGTGLTAAQLVSSSATVAEDDQQALPLVPKGDLGGLQVSKVRPGLHTVFPAPGHHTGPAPACILRQGTGSAAHVFLLTVACRCCQLYASSQAWVPGNLAADRRQSSGGDSW